jgi:hypothetical protein
VKDVRTLRNELESLLRSVADEGAPIDEVEAWFQRHVEPLRSSDSEELKSAVQRALAYAWSWRTGGTADAEARASLKVLAARL